MTREEAIARLKVLTDYEYDEDLEALEIAIKALELLTSYEHTIVKLMKIIKENEV